jgi:hypothetical protein
MQRLAIAAVCAVLAGCASRQPALTDYTVNSGIQRGPGQEALVFDHADLSLRIDPDSHSLAGDALLTFGTRAALDHIDLDLDRNLPIAAIAVDGRPLAASAWRNPDGKLTITLPQPLTPGLHTTIRVTYHGEPHVAKRAPWDGGFVWAPAPLVAAGNGVALDMTAAAASPCRPARRSRSTRIRRSCAARIASRPPSAGRVGHFKPGA